jgi:HAD superfamily hydrolase (TIGR01509 family)
MRLQSAIFDMDGTLIDSMYMWNDLGVGLMRDLGVEPEPDLHDKIKVMTIPGGAAYCKETYHLTQSVDEIVAMTEERIERFYREEVQAKPGVEKFLSLLKMEGVWMYIATATERRLAEIALKHVGIDQYFRGLITSSEAGEGKNTSPEIYERAMRRLQSNKKDTVVFEDALHAIQTAKAAGFRVCAIYDPSAEADQPEIQRISDYYIRSFEEMFEILDEH